MDEEGIHNIETKLENTCGVCTIEWQTNGLCQRPIGSYTYLNP